MAWVAEESNHHDTSCLLTMKSRPLLRTDRLPGSLDNGLRMSI